ncbi:MAG: hypothetical protein SGI83_03070 [Bacteroidota bacterium]|nr:hypothetical protein [Bacteroidota bacterium]
MRETRTEAKAWIIKVNGENGGRLWERYYGDESANSFTSIQDLIQSNRSYFATGVTRGSTIYIVKLNGSGNKDWENFITPQNSYNLVTPRILYVTINRDIYLIGMKNNDQSNPGNLFMMKLKE